MKNIGIIGKFGSGKSTVADYLVKEYGYHKNSLAAPMRDIVRNILGIQDKTDPRYRPAMQELGTEWGRKYNQNCWVDYLINNLDNGHPVVVDDVRFPNEAEALLKEGWMLIYLQCDDELRKQRCLSRDGNYDPATEKHASELGVEEIVNTYGQFLIYVDATLPKDEVLAQIDNVINGHECLTVEATE